LTRNETTSSGTTSSPTTATPIGASIFRRVFLTLHFPSMVLTVLLPQRLNFVCRVHRWRVAEEENKAKEAEGSEPDYTDYPIASLLEFWEAPAHQEPILTQLGGAERGPGAIGVSRLSIFLLSTKLTFTFPVRPFPPFPSSLFPLRNPSLLSYFLIPLHPLSIPLSTSRHQLLLRNGTATFSARSRRDPGGRPTILVYGTVQALRGSLRVGTTRHGVYVLLCSTSLFIPSCRRF
jgi:hypothetical protein